MLTYPGVRRPGQGSPRQELRHPLEEGLRAGDIAVGKELGNDRRVEGRSDRAPREDRLDLGGEDQLSVRQREVERLDSEPVPGEEQPPARAVPHREREHALQPLHAALTFLLVEVHDRLGVAAGTITMAASLEPRSELRVVVDLTVEDDPHAAVLVGHGLSTALDVDDREAPEAQAHVALAPQPLAVGSAVAQDVSHDLQARLVHGLEWIQTDDADDAAHGARLLRSPACGGSRTRPSSARAPLP